MKEQIKKETNPNLKKRYSMTEKMDALAILRDSGYDYTKTSRITSVSTPSLRAWYNKHGKQVKQESEEIEAIMDSSIKLQKHKGDLMEEIYDTKFQIIKRIQGLVPTARNIRVLGDALLVLHDMSKQEENPLPTSLLGDNNRDFVLQFVSNQIAVMSPDGKIIRANKTINNNNNDHGENQA